MRRAAILLAVAAAVVAGACERETRRYTELPAAADRSTTVRLTTLQPGAPQPPPAIQSPYQYNAYGIAEGKRLYNAYNCSGCHAMAGGGSIGPALIDDKWIYGSAPDQLFSTIKQGRPDGMPSFGGHIPDQQIWQLVAYVESMAGLVSQDAAPGRNDDQMAKRPEARKEDTAPKQTGHR